MENLEYDKNIVIAVDFDGTITKSDNFPNDEYEIDPKSIKWLKKIRKLPVILILWSCNEKRINRAKELEKYGIFFDYINNYSNIRGESRKINADFYIDDRANDHIIRWGKIYKLIKKSCTT